MSVLNFEQPSMDWDSPDIYNEYLRFRQHVEFVYKGPLCKADKKDKAGWLGMWLGKHGREVYKTLAWDEGEQDDPEIILKKFEDYVRPRKNKRAARFRVKQRKQTDGESFDNFVKDLRLILMDCEYADTDDILVDAIIAGVAHTKVRERLLDQGHDLTLAKTLQIGRQYELSQKQLKMFQGAEYSEAQAVSSIKTSRPQHNKKTVRQTSKRKTSVPKQQNSKPMCNRCGLDPSTNHLNNKCPALKSTCRYCKLTGHWKSVCRKRQQSQMNISDVDEHDLLDILATDDTKLCQENTDRWLVTLHVCEKPMKFRIDTGAKCNIIVSHQYHQSKLTGVKSQSNKLLRSFTNHTIRPEFHVQLPLRNEDTNIQAEFEIVDIHQENVITGITAERLNLIQRMTLQQRISSTTFQNW